MELLSLEEAAALSEHERLSGLGSLKPRELTHLLRTCDVPFKEIAAANSKQGLLQLAHAKGIMEIPDAWTFELMAEGQQGAEVSIGEMFSSTVPGAGLTFEEQPHGSALLPVSPWKLREGKRRKMERRNRGQRAKSGTRRKERGAQPTGEATPHLAPLGTAEGTVPQATTPPSSHHTSPAAASARSRTRTPTRTRSSGPAASSKHTTERAETAIALREVSPDGPSMEDLRMAIIAGRSRPEVTPRKYRL